MDENPTPAASAGDVRQETELDRLKERIASEKKLGLKDVKFFPGDVSNATVESFAKDVNEMLNGKEVPITDID